MKLTKYYDYAEIFRKDYHQRLHNFYSEVYERLAKKYKPDYLFDAQTLITPSFDNFHFKEEDHYVLAKALASFFETKDCKI